MVVRGRKGRGRPKKRWKNCVNQDLHEKNLSGIEIHCFFVAQLNNFFTILRNLADKCRHGNAAYTRQTSVLAS
ncbi:hypothetical protein WDU94_006732 [Cyamophila willieti]